MSAVRLGQRRPAPPRTRRYRHLLAALASTAVMLGVLCVGSASAFKPYTHNYGGYSAYDDAVDDCAVTVDEREYNLAPRLCEALQKKRAHYNAGVVGPDGYPDVIMGQGIIHPGADDPDTPEVEGDNADTPEDEGTTGAWLKWVLKKAWEAQVDTSAAPPFYPDPYTNDEKLEILAFAYGFLTHAAGDMWAHTLVNDFSQGVFPPVAEIATDANKAKIAFRHIVIEGYIGDATPGYDGNPNRTVVPNETNEDGDPQVSDDATPGIHYETPPDRFLWEVFIGRQADAQGHYTLALPGQPTASRGALIELFYGLRDDLRDEASSFTSLDDALASFNSIEAHWNAVVDLCDPTSDNFDVPECILEFGETILDLGTSGIAAAKAAALDAAIEVVTDAYMREWIKDIDHGLHYWSNIGHAFTKGLFDPHARREYQDEECGQELFVTETSAQRIECENGIGAVGTFLDVLGESMTTEDPALLSMLGLPDAALFAAELIDEVTDPIDEILPGLPFLEAELKAWAEKKVKELIKEQTGLDVDQLQELLKNPATFLDAALPAPPFPPGIVLFNLGDHERLDRIIGFPGAGPLGGHHAGSNRLEDNAELVPANFAPLKNAVTMSKMLLLAGGEVDRMLGDILGRQIDTYSDEVINNVMTDSLGENDTPWLRSIDSDHAWRQDGLPVFCEGPNCNLARQVHYVRPVALRGGTGRMPIWESCVLRPAFGELFTDWENGTQQWPALGDRVSADPGSDNWAPRSYLDRTGVFYPHPDGRQFVGGDNAFTIRAHDDLLANRGFPDSALGIRYRVTNPAGVVGSWVTASQGTKLSLSSAAGGDGKYVIEVQAEDPCHTFEDNDGLDPAGSIARFEYWLDTTPPKVTFDDPPFGRTFDTDDFSAVDYEVDDGPNGSGVKSESSTIDGYEVLPGVVATSDGATLDMYMYYPGTRTVTVTATDNIGNSGVSAGTFRIEATPDSLINNLNRARSEGDVPYTDVYRGLMDKLVQTKRQHEKGMHGTEWNTVDAFADQLEGQRGKGIDLIVANRFIAYARLRIALGQ